ncbi:MAG TPA: DnaJ C-terminal domain-containing protein, partial [Tahibacter sp.]|nr:DnaJ C-terminal domain-containing protein [Tahibacter sp.]
FESLFGRGRGGGPGARSAGPRRGQDLRAHAAIDLETAFAGGKQRLDINGRKLDVRIPAGIQQGQVIRLAGQGHPGLNGAQAGDLLLEILVEPHQRFALDGRNVVVTLPLAPWEAALGATVKVPTLAGDVDLKIPAGSDSGRKLRLKGRGMPGGAEAGDQFVVLEVRAPAATTDEQRALYESMAQTFEFRRW